MEEIDLKNTINIIDFSKSISYDDLEKDINRFFDENFILYRLVGGLNGINISSECGNRASYRITITDANVSIDQLVTYFKNVLMCMYGTLYKLEVSCDNNDILITFDKLN